jgi:hypothetical protein
VLCGNVSKLSVTFTLDISPDSAPYPISGVLRDHHQSKSESVSKILPLVRCVPIKHTIPYMKLKLKLLQFECHVLEFTKDGAQKMLHMIIRVFAEAFVSNDRHTLFTLEESVSPRTTYAYESQ